MDLLEALLFGIVQGVAEFLPISSSGHLVLVPWWLHLDNPPLVYTVMVHLGTTMAVLFYFWRDWLVLAQAGAKALYYQSFDLANNPELRLLVLLIIGTIPATLAGLLLADSFEEAFSEPAIVSVCLIVTAGLISYGEWKARQAPSSFPKSALRPEPNPTPEQMRFIDAIFIGVAQAIAIMPGISRSGSTIAAGLFRGLDHAAAVRYSFLLSTPIILGAGAKEALDLLTGDITVSNDLAQALVVGFLSAAIVGYVSIAFMLRVIRRLGLYGFAIYCVAFGLLSLGAVWLRG